MTSPSPGCSMTSSRTYRSRKMCCPSRIRHWTSHFSTNRRRSTASRTTSPRPLSCRIRSSCPSPSCCPWTRSRPCPFRTSCPCLFLVFVALLVLVLLALLTLLGLLGLRSLGHLRRRILRLRIVGRAHERRNGHARHERNRQNPGTKRDHRRALGHRDGLGTIGRARAIAHGKSFAVCRLIGANRHMPFTARPHANGPK